MEKEKKLKAIKKELRARQKKAKSESVIYEKIINENIDLAFKILFKD